MEVMDLLLACEDLVPQVACLDSSADGVAEADIDRWQRLFAFSASEAADQILRWRSTFGRYAIAADNWELIKGNVGAADFDKESYEYAVASGRLLNGSGALPKQRHLNHYHQHEGDSPASTLSYLFRLEGPIPDAQTLMDVAGLQSPPEVLAGSSDTAAETEAARFCVVDGKTRLRVLQQMADLRSTFRPTFIRDAKAKKDLSPHSAYPTLGVDSTLPHHRASRGNDVFSPSQREYPVWYFFYGTLEAPDVLSRVINSLPTGLSRYHSASVRGGRLTTWAAKYKALVDGSGDKDVVHGSAYLVRSAEDEDALRYYETDKYEVVRCRIQFKGSKEECMGLTFRFIS